MRRQPGSSARGFGSDDRVKIRVSALGLAMLMLISVLASRLWFLQILAGDQFSKAANANRVRLVSVAAPRGKILDRNGRVLVGTRTSLTVGIRRTDLRNQDVVLPRLGALLKMPVAQILKKLADKRVSPYKPVTIAEEVPREIWLMLSERRDEFPGVETGAEPVRLYPGGNFDCSELAPGETCSIAAHVIGYVGEISGPELDKLRGKGYRLGDEIGRAGIERTYEEVLRGRPGIEKLEVDSRGTVLRSLGTQEPIPGRDVQLSIDLSTQKVAEEALALGIQRARSRVFDETKERFRAPAGGVVVLEANTGEVLAMASYPTFDLTKFSGGIDPDYWKLLNDPANDQPLLNRTIQAAYPPGSTFKPFIATGALETGKATPGSRFACTTEFKFGDRIFRNWRPGNSTISLSQALIESCDTPFYRIGADWWEVERAREKDNKGIFETAKHWALRFGLGRKTGIDLSGEVRGRIPGRDYKRDVWSRNREKWCAKFRKATDKDVRAAFEDLCVRGYLWRGGDAVNMSIGQGDVLTSALQVGVGYAAVANGGNVIVPHLGRQIIDPATKQAVKVIQPKPASQTGVAAENQAYLRDALTQVPERGTAASPFAGWPFSRIGMAAKTGSAEIVGKQPYSWFAAYAPANAPKYVVISVVEEAGFGSQVSGPIARRIMDHLFKLQLSAIEFDTKRSD